MRTRIFAFSVLSVFVVISCASCNRTGNTRGPDEPEKGADEEDLARETLDQLVAGDFAAVFDRFDSTMKGAVPLTQLEAVWEAVLRDAGSFLSVISDTRTQAGALETVVLLCEFQSASVNVQISFNDAGEIIGLLIRPA